MTIQVKYKHLVQRPICYFMEEQYGFDDFEDDYVVWDHQRWPFYNDRFWKGIRTWKYGKNEYPLVWNKDDYPYAE